MWLARYILMEPDTYISYDEFYAKSIGRIESKESNIKSKDEIMDSVNNIIKYTISPAEVVIQDG